MELESVFIAYSKDGAPKAYMVDNYLEKLGVNIYLFEKYIKTNPGLQITDEILSRDDLILIISNRSRDSRWVSHELGIASGSRKRS